MAEELQGTNIEKDRGKNEFFEVEDLIKETLEESKVLERPATQQAKPKEEFKATEITLPRQEKPVPPPPEKKPPQKPAAEAPREEAGPYESTFKEYKVGDIVKGSVIKVDPGGVLVDIKYKADGLILPEELADKTPGSPEEIVKVGDVIKVLIENLENKEGYVVLSKKKAEYELRWNLAYDALKSKKVLEGKVIQTLKGGLVVDCEGIRGFIPASQVQKKIEESLDSFKDKMLPLNVIEVNRRQGKIVLSHKMAVPEASRLKSDKLLEDVEVGQVRHGTVSSLKSFGAFVDIGGVEGLIHISELSWKRVKHPSELLKVGQELDVFVLGVDKVNKKVALGLKELQPDPWVNAAGYYKPGMIVKARVARFAKFGAFAELDHSLEGLIHISEASSKPVQKIEDALKIDEVVDVKVLRVLPEEQKIGLSVREAIIQKEKEAARETAAAAAVPAVSAGEEKKVTIADMIAEKEKAKAEREAEEAAEEPQEEPT